MRSGAIARFGDITAYGDVFHGIGFHLVDLSGWSDGPNVDMENVPRPTQHGQFPAVAFARSLDVRMSGFHVAESHAQMEHASAQVRGLLTRVVQLTIEDTKGTFWAYGTVEAASYVNHGFAPEGQWLVNVHCPDPCKHGRERVAGPGTSMSVQQFGNFPASPVIEVTGSMPAGYTINGPAGKRYVVTQSLSAGQTHLIDMADGVILRDGSPQVGVVGQADLWDVPPSVPVGMSLVPVSGSGLMTVTVTDTYI